MSATVSGRILKTRKGKRGTAHQRNHRWESFTTNISKLNTLDPIRKVRRHDFDAEEISTTTFYFKAGLAKWSELNITEDFLSFSRQVRPMSDSLPQLLHFEDKIMETLSSYICKQEKWSLQPFLELLTDFARDLGARFEKHYARALELLTSIAGSPQDVEVIEWVFTSLAFLFKYLSRLLVPNIQPTYDVMAPLLGKQRNPPHIARFAAEALSFLIRKSGGPVHREKTLPSFVRHVKHDLFSMLDTREFGLYYHGVMTMFAEAMKGNGIAIHTSGPAIMEVLVTIEDEDAGDDENSSWSNVVFGVLTSVIHHTNTESFKDIEQSLISRANAMAASFQASISIQGISRLLASARLLGIAVGVRMASRISDWSALLEPMSNILISISRQPSSVASLSRGTSLWTYLVASVSVILQYTPIDAVSPFIDTILKCLTKEPLAGMFLTFSSYLSQMSPGRFRALVLPYFQRFVVAHWSDSGNDDTLCVLLPRMISTGVLSFRQHKDGFELPQSWQDQIVSKFERLEVSPFPEQASWVALERCPKTWQDRCLPQYNALLELLEYTIVSPSTTARIAEILLRKLKLALRPSSSLASDEANFIVGTGFIAYVQMSKAAGAFDGSLRPLLRAAAPRYCRLPKFLEALLIYESILPLSPTKASKTAVTEVTPTSAEKVDEVDLLVKSLIANLSSASHELRLLSLQLLQLLQSADQSKSEALQLMITVEQTPLDLQTSRTVSMHIRKLAIVYPKECSKPEMRQAIPAFCFGMLSVKLAHIWEDAIMTLKQISESKIGEEAVAVLAFQWLDTPSAVWSRAAKVVNNNENNGRTDFECLNLMNLDKLAAVAYLEVVNIKETMLQKFAEAQRPALAKHEMARSQALRVLSSIPKIAEKRSRQLVPMFLSWASNDSTSEDNDSQDGTTSDWTRKDQKALLELFGRFTNPKSLYKAMEIHEALARLLANGDIDIQKLALQAILTWKDNNIHPYEENLMNILDESRFKDEVGVLLQGDTLIQSDHRSNLMPVLLRLLYGRTISRKGVGNGKQGMEARRATVIRNLDAEDVGKFLDIALGDLKDVRLTCDNVLQPWVLEKEYLNIRKQVGFTHMMEGLLKELGTNAARYTCTVLEPLLYCLVFASRRLSNDLLEANKEMTQVGQTSMLKNIRQTALKCLIRLFDVTPELDWSSYLKLILDEVILQRLEHLPSETGQGVSAILRLFYTWANSRQTVSLLGSDHRIIPTIVDCVTPQVSKDEVRLYSLNIVKRIIYHAVEDEKRDGSAAIRSTLLDCNVEHILRVIGSVLRSQQDMHKELLEACIETVSDLAPLVSTSNQAYDLVDVSVFLLDQPSRRSRPKAKAGLIQILEHFVPLYALQDDDNLKCKVYDTVTSLFGFFKDKPSREVLSRVLQIYSDKDPVIAEVANICAEMNTFVQGRLDEPDYDRRLGAFVKLKASRAQPFTARQWRPILYNMLFYINFEEEFNILSSNSSDGICSFIDAAGNAADSTNRETFMTLLTTILMPAIFSGVREPSEVIRREYLKVMAHVIRTLPLWLEVSDMYGLLSVPDEVESSFFNNILTAGKGRQLSALKLLSSIANGGELGSKNVSRFFIPLLEHFILNRHDGNDAHNLAAEASITISVLANSLEWQHYRAVLRRFIGYVQSMPQLEKQLIKHIGKFVDTLAFAVEVGGNGSHTLAGTLPKQSKLADDLSSNIIPPLVAYLHHKDETTVSQRVPVAIIVVRLLKLLPQDQLSAQLPAVLTDICHILRSKAPEARDMARDTLTKICVLLGPSCFGFVLKELRGALSKGYQLHVMSYTMHSILVATTPTYAPGDLDYCLPAIVAVILDDIFGAVGQEKDAEEYISQMKEVRSSKSQDSMELIASRATLGRLTELVHPIQVLLREKLNLRMVRKIDELLSRINSGVLRNPAAESRDSLVFCYEIIQDSYSNGITKELEKQDHKLKRYLVQKGAAKSGHRGTTTMYSYKLVPFALNLLRSLFKRYDSLRTVNNLAGFLPILGDAAVQAEEEVRISAFKLLTAVVKVPLKITSDGTDLYRVAAAAATKCIFDSSTTASDIAQASLKLISVVLHNRRDVDVKDTAVDQILTRLRDDLTEPDRRHVTFNFLRAVLDSRVETAVVYDTLDYVGTTMVTNDAKDTRNLARGAYFQFLREYPQKKNRWAKQLGFIVANLKYEREGGRSSILEVIHLLLSKSSKDFVQEVAATCFMPLIFVLANDESEKCRMATGEVVKEIFQKADRERLKTFLTLLRSWIGQSENLTVLRLAYQTFGLYFESQEMVEDADVEKLVQSIRRSLDIADTDNTDWEIIYSALQLAAILCAKFPVTLLASKNAALWSAVRNCLSYPHAWTKLSAARLTSTYFADIARTNIENNLEGLPLKGSRGLELNAEDLNFLVRRITAMLRTPNLGELLAEEIVKNLLFLSRCADANNLVWKTLDGGQEGEAVGDEQEEATRTLEWLFGRLSYLLRQETTPPRAPALVPKIACLQLISHISSKISLPALVTSLPCILLPLHNLTDPAIASPYSTEELFRKHYQDMKDKAAEIMDALKQKVGMEEYMKIFSLVREGVKERRIERRGKRKIEAISQPEKSEIAKRKKGVRQKERKKEKGQEWRALRMGQ